MSYGTGSSDGYLTSSVATLKKIENPRRASEKPQKTPGQICTDFAKKSNFSWKKSNFSGKKWLFFAKISDDLFLVINSDFQIQLVPYFFTKNHLLSTKNTAK